MITLSSCLVAMGPQKKKEKLTKKATVPECQESKSLQLLLNQLPDPAFILDAKGAILFINKPAITRLQCSKKDLTRLRFTDMVDKSLSTKVHHLLQDALNGMPGLLVAEISCLTGSPVKMETRFFMNFLDGKEAIVAICREIIVQPGSDEMRIYQEEMFYKAFQSNPSLMAISSFNDSRYIDVNDSFLNKLGYARNEIIGKTSTELQLYVDLIQSDKFLKKLKTFGKVRDFEISFRTKQGTVRKGLFSAETIQLRGEPCLLSIIHDITEVRQTREILEQTELRYKEVLENMSNCVVMFEAVNGGLDFNIIEFNPAAEKVENASRASVLGKNVKEAFPVAIGTGFYDCLKRVYQTGKPEQKLINFDGADGRRQWRDNFVYKLPSGELVSIYEDITEKKAAEENIAVEKAYLEQLIESAPEAIVVLDNEGRIQRINSEFTRLFGYEESELIGQLIDDLLAPDEQHEEALDITHTIARGHRVEKESLRRCKDGRLVDVSIMGTPIIFNQSQVGVYGIYRDISQRKKAEKVQNLVYQISSAVITTKNLNDLSQVIKSELSQIMDTTNFFIALYNREDQTLSLPFFRDEKDSFDEIPAGKTITAYVIKSQQPVLLRESDMEELEKQGEIDLVGSTSKLWLGVPLRAKDEIIGVISVQSYNDPLAYSHDDLDILEFVASQVGISIQWKKAEEALFDSLQRYRAVAETTIAGIAITGKEAEFTYVNKAFAEMLDYQPDELTGLKFSHITSERTFHQFVNQTAVHESGKQNQFELSLQRKDGVLLNALISSSPLFDEQHVYQSLLVVMIDITPLKEIQKELILAKEQAEEAVRAKQQFLSTMSHEIRTPLNAVIGMSQLLLQEEPRPDQEENLKTLSFSADNLLVLINDILDFNKIEAGKVIFEKIDFNFRDLMNGIKQTFLFKAVEKNIELRLSDDPKVPDLLIGDPGRLSQVITNLLANAIKFTEEGYVELKIRYAGTKDDDIMVEFVIEDTGIGIPADKLDTIFESFTQADTDTSRKYGGTGLGLAISKQLLALRKSELKVESTPGKGSRFFFTLGFQPSKLKELKTMQEFARLKYEKLKGRKILLVEDNKMNQIVASKFLQKWGVDLDIADNGKIAVEKFGKKTYDLVLMDLQMPVMSGFEASKYIRDHLDKERKTPILAMTASLVTEISEKIHDSLMDDFIMKPFNPNELYIKIVKNLKS